MSKFDVYNFLHESHKKRLLREQGEEDDQQNPVVGDPQAAQQGQGVPAQDPTATDGGAPQGQQGGEEQTADQASQQVQSTTSPFDQFTGATIDNIEFKPHENGGAVVIKHSLSPLPLVISWTGDRVTSKYKDVTPLT